MKRWFSLLAAFSVALVLGAVTAPAASAHTATITGVARCAPYDGTPQVVWTLTNDYNSRVRFTEVSSTGGGVLRTLPLTVPANGGDGVTTGRVIQGGVDVSTGEAKLTVNAVWADGATQDGLTATVRLTDNCDDTPLVPVTPAGPGIAQSQQCGVEGTLTVPATEHVVYRLNDEIVAAGDYPGPLTGSLTAAPEDGYVIADGAETSWTVDIPAAEVCPEGITPVEPTIAQSQQCDVEGTLTVPTTDHVTYTLKKDGEDAKTVEAGDYPGPITGVLVAKADEGYALKGQRRWDVAIAAAEECPTNPGTSVTPPAPVIAPAQDCENEGTLTIPTSSDVTYELDGEPVEAGVLEGPLTGTLTAVPNPGVVLTGKTSWDISITSIECVVSPEELVPPNPQAPSAVPNTGGELAFTGPVSPWILLVATSVILLGLGLRFGARRFGRTS